MKTSVILWTFWVFYSQSGPGRSSNFVNPVFTVSSSLTIDAAGYSAQIYALIDALFPLETMYVKIFGTFPTSISEPLQALS